MIPLSLAYEILVSLLLIVTIGYCFVLDRKLKALRNGQDGVRQSIAELVQATIKAETAMHGLHATSAEIQGELDEKMIEARTLARHLTSAPINKLRGDESRGNRDDGPDNGALMGRLKKVG